LSEKVFAETEVVRIRHLDGAVARRRDDVLLVEVHHVDGGTMTNLRPML
jgi:hypothetical protein